MTESKETKRKSFMMYTSYIAQIKKLSREEKGELLEAIYDYQLEGEVSSQLSPLVDMVFSFMQEQFDLDREKYDEKCDRLDRNKKRSYQKDDAEDDITLKSDRYQHDVFCNNNNNNNNKNNNNNNNNNTLNNNNNNIAPADRGKRVESFACGEGESESEGDKKERSDKGFEAFWEAYPRKQGRKDALSAWKKIKPPWGISHAEPLGSSNHPPLAVATDVASIFSLPCVKGGGTACRDGGIVLTKFYEYNPSVSFADSSPCTGEPAAVAGTVQS